MPSLPKDPFEPAGSPEDLDRIVEWLVDPTKRGEDARAPIRSEVRRYLHSFAGDLLHGLHVERASPSPAEGRERLEKLAQRARALLRAITNTERGAMFGMLRLEDQAAQLRGVTSETSARGALKLLLGPSPTTAEHPLEALARVADAAKARHEAAKHFGQGRASFYSRVAGHPHLVLARRCVWALRRYRGPKAAPIKDGGPVSDLMEKLSKYAMGTDLPADSNMDWHAKMAARAARGRLKK